MPKFLEDILKREYGASNNHAVYGTLNKIGAMRGNKVTPKGEAMQAKHEAERKEDRKEFLAAIAAQRADFAALARDQSQSNSATNAAQQQQLKEEKKKMKLRQGHSNLKVPSWKLFQTLGRPMEMI